VIVFVVAAPSAAPARAGAATGPAATGPRTRFARRPAATTARSPIARLHVRGASLASTIDGMISDSFALLGGVSTTGSAPPASAEIRYMLPAGDLDGDGAGDIIGISGESSPTGTTWTLHARRGSNGAPLWSLDVHAPGFDLVPARVGPGAAPGLLLFSYGCPAVCGSVRQLEIRAMAGTGQTIWSSVFTGAVVGEVLEFAAYEFPVPVGTFHAEGGALTDVLLERVTSAFGTNFVRIEADVVSGTTGATLSSQEFTTVRREPVAIPTLDLSGDGRDDYVVRVGASDPPGTLSARRGDTGAVIWEQDAADVDQNSFVVDARDATGDGRNDVVLWKMPRSRYPVNLALLDGTSGAVRFARTGFFPHPLGNVSGTGASAVGSQLTDKMGNTVTVRYDAWDGMGASLYSHSYSLTVPSGFFVTSATSGDSEIGDVQPDGIPDASHDIEFTEIFPLPPHTTREGGVVNGKTGLKLWSGDPGFALRASIDGHGDDLIRFPFTGNATARAVAVDGLTGTVLWSSVQPTTGESVSFIDATGADFTNDGRAEVLLAVDSLTGSTDFVQFFILRAIDGAVLWHT
jgi:hypothetical protein